MFFSGFGKRFKSRSVKDHDDILTTKATATHSHTGSPGGDVEEGDGVGIAPKHRHAERNDLKAIVAEELLSAFELQKSRKSPKKPSTASASDTINLLKKTTRKKFGLVLEEDEVPDNLLCEECVRAYAVNYCYACEQVLCTYCCEICHPRVDVNNKHPHIVQKQIREIRAGDTSKAFIEKPYPMPVNFLEEPDYELLTGRDLSQPNALAINLLDNHPQKATQPFKAARFQVDEKLVFIDPVSKQEAYGRVISEWDFRHGCPSAPSIKRGEGSIAWYMVELLGYVKDIGNIDTLVKMILAKPPPPLLPEFAEDVQSIPYRNEFALARTVNAMLEAAREVAEHGPRRHYKPELVQVLPRGAASMPQPEDDGGTVVSALESVHTFGQTGGGGFGGLDGGPSMASIANDTAINLSLNGTIDGSQAKVPGVSADGSPKKTKNDEDSPKLPPSPRGAAARSFHDAIHDPLLIGPGAPSEEAQKQERIALLYPKTPKEVRLALRKAAERDARLLAVLLIAEKDLTRPEDLLQDNTASLDTSQRDRCLRRCIKRTTRRLLTKGLVCWKNQLEHLLAVKRFLMSRAIQKYARRWLCRNKLAEKQEAWEAELRAKWTRVHAQFRYATTIESTSKTLEPFKHLYFQTTLDANKYASFLRLITGKIWNFVDRKRLSLLRRYVSKWQDGTLESLNEGDIKSSHFAHETADLDKDEVTSPGELQHLATSLYRAFQKKGARAVSTDENQYTNVSSLDLAYVRTVTIPTAPIVAATNVKNNKPGAKNKPEPRPSTDAPVDAPVDPRRISTTAGDSKQALPPYHPSLGVVLPAAVPVFMPKSAHDRLFASQETRLRYGAYKANMTGPTDDSCWCIPGRVAMGAIPFGVANKRQSTPAITALLLEGVSTFVSLMEEEEEAAVCAKLGIDSIQARMKKAAVGSKFSVDQIVSECQRQIDIYDAKLAMIPEYAKSDPRFEEANKDKIRCNARIKLAKQKALVAKAKIDRFPKSFDWLRVPLPHNAAPFVNEILPHLWELERRLGDGQNLFLYSREGHGRVGMVGAMLVGRLYGFNPVEALTRIQLSHDCMTVEEKRPVPIACPQLPAQRNLVTQIVTHTNKPFQGVTWRSHSDPEHTTAETHRPKPGVGKGAPLTSTTSLVMPEIVDAAATRVKQSFSLDFRLERDVKRPPSSPKGRVHKRLPEPDQAALYEQYSHEQNVVRSLPVVLKEPAVRPSLPLLRTIRAGMDV